jgi:diguanylate cyclase (GGDEF)-like protein/PAS domain S-box-containing protein
MGAMSTPTACASPPALLDWVLAHMQQGVLIFDASQRVVQFNPRVCELLDLPADFLAGTPTLQDLSDFQMRRGDFGPNATLVEERARSYVRSGGTITLPSVFRRRTLQGRILEIRSEPMAGGGMARTITDVTDSLLAQQQIEAQEARWKLALECTGDGVWDLNVQTGEEYLSPNLLRMYGFEEGELNTDAASLDTRTHPQDLLAMRTARQDHLKGLTDAYINEHRVQCKDGSWKWVLSRGMVISRDPLGLPLRMIGTHTDITERKLAEARAWEQAHLDMLTGLPNRRLLRERLAQAIKHCRRDGSQLALLMLDLDHFKEVNDTLGHDAGDQLLVQVAARIHTCLREVDTVARMGGDEFMLIVTELHDPTRLEPLLSKLLTQLGHSFALKEQEVYVSASIGVTLHPQDGAEIEDLMKCADQALYAAKRAGRNRFHFFTADLQHAVHRRMQLGADLREALAQQQFQVVYQPIVSLADGRITKAEALLRWQHPVRGWVSPAEFIPVAEASGLIHPLGQWVLEQAAAQLAQWRARLHPQFQISVNRSPVQFEGVHGKPRAPWIDTLRQYDLPGDSLVVEITEGLLLSTVDGVIDELLSLRDDGIAVALDDFGTGYSSLAYLQRFEIDFIKIDQSFVRHLVPGSTDLALCQAMVAMAHALGMQVVAEGVETATQRDLLAQMGCDFAQGYFFSRPVAPAELERWLALG